MINVSFPAFLIAGKDNRVVEAHGRSRHRKRLSQSYCISEPDADMCFPYAAGEYWSWGADGYKFITAE